MVFHYSLQLTVQQLPIVTITTTAEISDEKIEDRPFRFMTLRGDIRLWRFRDEICKRCTGGLPSSSFTKRIPRFLFKSNSGGPDLRQPSCLTD
jgi:hypothetical protein